MYLCLRACTVSEFLHCLKVPLIVTFRIMQHLFSAFDPSSPDGGWCHSCDSLRDQIPPKSNPRYWVPSREEMDTILTVFGMTWPGDRIHNLRVSERTPFHQTTELVGWCWGTQFNLSVINTGARMRKKPLWDGPRREWGCKTKLCPSVILQGWAERNPCSRS